MSLARWTTEVVWKDGKCRTRGLNLYTYFGNGVVSLGPFYADQGLLQKVDSLWGSLMR